MMNLLKAENRITLRVASPPLSVYIYPEDMKLCYGNDSCTTMFTEARITVAKVWDQLKCP